MSLFPTDEKRDRKRERMKKKDKTKKTGALPKCRAVPAEVLQAVAALPGARAAGVRLTELALHHLQGCQLLYY